MTRRLTSAKRRKRTNKNIPAKGRLVQIADKLWSQAVREDWNHKCAVCGFTDRVEAHHLIPRQWKATRYDIFNGIALCATHHQFNADLSPHQNAAGWMAWLQLHKPGLYDWYTTNMERGDHRMIVTANSQYYCDVIRELKDYVDEEDYANIVGVRFAAWLDKEELPCTSSSEPS